MERSEIWENLTSKNSQSAKTYGINSGLTAICHLHAHEIIISQTSSKTEQLSFVTVGTFDRDFAVLQSRGFGQIFKDVEFKEVLRMRTDYPVMHCVLEHQFEAVQSRYLLIGYLIDIYANIYTLNLTKAIDYAQKYPSQPVQFTTVTRAFRRDAPLLSEDDLYLETPLFLKKCGSSIISLNLRGEILLLDITQSRSWISSDFSYQREELGAIALAAAHNRIPCKYENVIVVATRNSRTPYVFVNCTSTVDFENQKAWQDSYEWMEEQVQVSHCAIDPEKSLVCVATVAQTIDIFEIVEKEKERHYFLRKKFGFFIANNLHFTSLNIENNIENLHASKGFLLITACKEHIIYDLEDFTIRKRAKGSQVLMLKWGQIIDRKGNWVSMFLAKGYNHFNEAQSKMGKPNIHFRTLQLKNDK